MFQFMSRVKPGQNSQITLDSQKTRPDDTWIDTQAAPEQAAATRDQELARVAALAREA